jgi:hypothetical protein
MKEPERARLVATIAGHTEYGARVAQALGVEPR